MHLLSCFVGWKVNFEETWSVCTAEKSEVRLNPREDKPPTRALWSILNSPPDWGEGWGGLKPPQSILISRTKLAINLRWKSMRLNLHGTYMYGKVEPLSPALAGWFDGLLYRWQSALHFVEPKSYWYIFTMHNYICNGDGQDFQM